MFLRLLLDALFPVRHLSSGGEGEWLSVPDIRTVRSHPMMLGEEQLRAMSLSNLDRVIGAATFKDFALLRRAVHFLKYRRVRDIALPLSVLLADAARELDDDVPPVLCPVPLHWTRLFSRGFNQSELLAFHLACETGFECELLLSRSRATGHQVGRNRDQRLTALEGAFRYKGSSYPPEYVLLIDDLCTTGTTLDECARVLKNAGVSRVEALVLAIIR